MVKLNSVLYMRDEHLEEQITQCLQDFDTVQLLDVLNNEVELLERLKLHEPEILFVNLDMEGFDAADFFKLLSPTPPFIVGFTTEMERHWDCLEHGFFDIVGIPFLLTDFCRKMAKILKIVTALSPKVRAGLFASEASGVYAGRKTEKGGREFIQLRHRGAKNAVRFDDISYMKNVGNVIKVYTIQGKMFYHTSTLIKLLQDLPVRQFARINKSIIVNCEKVERMEHQMLYIGNEEFKISRTYSMELMEVFNNLCVIQGR